MRARNRIAVVGFIATAVAFGPGRMAYGLFLPQLKEEFSFGTGAAGGIASFAFAAFFLGLLLTGWLTSRLGPRLPVLVGGCVATVGFALAAVSSDLVFVSLGVAAASASAGFAWTPFNSITEHAVADRHQKRVLSLVSTGTAFGIIVAGLLALGVAALGQSWRIAWWTFATVGIGAIIAPILLLRESDEPGDQARLDMREVLGQLRSRAAFPLYGLAFSFGATNGTYLSYWIEHVTQSGGLAGLSLELTGPVLFVAFGLAGFLGILTGDVEKKIGLRALLLALFASSGASLMMLAYLPDSWAGAVVSAALQGICLMALSATYSFWSERLFPDIETTGFTAVLMIYALGNVIAPPLVGFVSSELGLSNTIALFSLLSFASLFMVRGVKEI
ncbi:MAG: MFS transporter [Mesorhizobium sp.]|nr:MFS transporter [Mesorhizobium sp.]